MMTSISSEELLSAKKYKLFQFFPIEIQSPVLKSGTVTNERATLNSSNWCKLIDNTSLKKYVYIFVSCSFINYVPLIDQLRPFWAVYK